MSEGTQRNWNEKAKRSEKQRSVAEYRTICRLRNGVSGGAVRPIRTSLSLPQNA